jgi:hypothetical protein
MEKYLKILTIGAEYKGSKNIYGCGIKSADMFESEILSKFEDRIKTNVSLRGFDCTSNNIISEIIKITSNLKNEKVIIYYTGHGNINGIYEYWDTSSGHVCQIKLAKIFNELPDCSSVVVFSDSCDSAHNINKLLMKKSYVTIGATRERQDANMSCDGGIFTQCLIKTLQNINSDCTVNEFWEKLNSYDVTVEEFTLACSDDNMLTSIMF